MFKNFKNCVILKPQKGYERTSQMPKDQIYHRTKEYSTFSKVNRVSKKSEATSEFFFASLFSQNCWLQELLFKIKKIGGLLLKLICHVKMSHSSWILPIARIRFFSLVRFLSLSMNCKHSLKWPKSNGEWKVVSIFINGSRKWPTCKCDSNSALSVVYCSK